MLIRELRKRMEAALKERSLAAIHTRPILLNLVDFGLIPQPDLEVTTVGRGKAQLTSTLDKPGLPTADLCFDPEGTHLPLLWWWMQENANGVLVGPYILYSSVFTGKNWNGFRAEADRLSKEKGLVQVYVPFKVTQMVEPKRHFAPILQGAGVEIPFFIEGTTPKIPDWEEVKDLFGEKCVVQTDDSAGGSGTKIVGVYHEWDEAVGLLQECLPGLWFRIVEFVDGYETNGQAVVLPGGMVLVDPLSHKPSAGKILNVTGGKPQGAVGDDWTNAWPKWVQSRYIEVMVKVGRYLHQKLQYIGLFGIDFLVNLEKRRLVPHEINARYQGTSFQQDRRALMLGRPSTFTLWLLASLGEEDFSWINPEDYNLQAAKESGGWQFDSYPLPGTPLPVPIAGDLNGWWKWDEERGLISSDEKQGEILCFAPLPGQSYTKETRSGNPRLLAPAQLYYWPQARRKALPPIFHPEREELTTFGQQVIPNARGIMYGQQIG